MATYVIGDLQGCFYSFNNLLKKCDFSPRSDQLWLVGDLVNRGPFSLEVLRWLYAHQDCVTSVLGNHDLHALAVYEGIAKSHRNDTLQALVDANDSEQLFDWLRHQRLAHYEMGCLMVHAGLLPQWDAETANALAQEVEHVLHGGNYREFLSHMYDNQPDQWNDNLKGMERLRIITNAMTRLRVCSELGKMEFRFKGSPKDIPEGYMPWFEIKSRRSRKDMLIVGHWSALGLVKRKRFIALDSGCLWGGKLTACRLEDRKFFQVPRAPEDSPKRK